MSTNQPNNKKRDWLPIIFILPLGVAMMLCVGQLAIRMVPNWSVQGEMKSLLDPEVAAKQDALIVPPVSSDILTPVSWWNTFLTPMADSGLDVIFPPFVVFEPSATPSATASPWVTSSTSPTATPIVTWTPSPTKITSTPKPTDDDEDDDTPTPAPTCTDPVANNNGGPLPCDYTPTTCTDPAANNNGGPLPCDYTPTTCTDSTANNNGGLLPCIYPTSSPLVGNSTPVPGNIGVNSTPNGTIGIIQDGYYVVIDLGSPILRVNGPTDTDADMVYYEEPSGSNGIIMDRVIISISMNGTDYYVVFNWGDGIPDNNSNVGDVTTDTGTENDNQPIDEPDTGELYGTAPNDTGILIDVDNAPSNPPVGDYQYIAIQAPSSGSTDDLGVDSIEIDEVPIPPP